MTSYQRPGPPLTDMLRRLRARPASSWQFGTREQTMRAALQTLADLAADARSEHYRPVPDVGVMGLADQFAVLVAEARDAGVSDRRLAEIRAGLADELGLRPS